MATVSHPADSEHLYALVQGYGTNGKDGKKEQKEEEGIEPQQHLTENKEAVPVKKTKSEGVSFNFESITTSILQKYTRVGQVQ